jgi:hypothetical protein
MSRSKEERQKNKKPRQSKYQALVPPNSPMSWMEDINADVKPMWKNLDPRYWNSDDRKEAIDELLAEGKTIEEINDKELVPTQETVSRIAEFYAQLWINAGRPVPAYLTDFIIQ